MCNLTDFTYLKTKKERNQNEFKKKQTQHVHSKND